MPGLQVMVIKMKAHPLYHSLPKHLSSLLDPGKIQLLLHNPRALVLIIRTHTLPHTHLIIRTHPHPISLLHNHLITRTHPLPHTQLITRTHPLPHTHLITRTRPHPISRTHHLLHNHLITRTHPLPHTHLIIRTHPHPINRTHPLLPNHLITRTHLQPPTHLMKMPHPLLQSNPVRKTQQRKLPQLSTRSRPLTPSKVSTLKHHLLIASLNQSHLFFLRRLVTLYPNHCQAVS